MNAGRELDMLVAEKVMGWTWSDTFNCYCYSDGRPLGYPFVPSTDISDAWKAIEKLKSWCFTITNFGTCGAVLCCIGGGEVTADTVCESICLAALMAVENENEKNTESIEG